MNTVCTETAEELALQLVREAYSADRAGNQVAARRLLESPAAAPNITGVFDLAIMLSRGEGGPIDRERAFKLFHKVANTPLPEKGIERVVIPEAMHNLATYYDDGKIAVADKPLAALWYRKAAILGVPHSQVNLGLMLVTGEGIPQDEAEGFMFLHAAAEFGEPSAHQSVGALLVRRGGSDNLVEALKWYLILLRSNPKIAGNAIADLQRRLKPTEIERAEKAARDWKPRGTPFSEGLIEP